MFSWLSSAVLKSRYMIPAKCLNFLALNISLDRVFMLRISRFSVCPWPRKLFIFYRRQGAVNLMDRFDVSYALKQALLLLPVHLYVRTSRAV